MRFFPISNNVSHMNVGCDQARLYKIRAYSALLRLQELFQRQQGNDSSQYGTPMMSSHFQSGPAAKSHPSSPAKTGRVYTSVAEMKRKGKVRIIRENRTILMRSFKSFSLIVP